MIGRTNVANGLRLRASDAVLRVVSMTGATVTITKNGIARLADGHEDFEDSNFSAFYFIVQAIEFDSVNAWTVEAVKEEIVISDTIIIDSPDEYRLNLSKLWLYDHGTQYVTFGGVKSTNSSYSFQDDRIYTYSNSSKNYSTVSIFTVDKIDLTPWKSITYRVDYYSQTSGNAAFAVGAASNKNNPPTFVAKVNPSKNSSGTIQTITVDITSLADLYYVAYGGAASTYTYEIYLSS